MRILTTALKGIVSLAFSGNGSLLAVAGVKQDLTIWDWVAGEQIHRIPRCNLTAQFALSPDGLFLAGFTTHFAVFPTNGQASVLPPGNARSETMVDSGWDAGDGRPMVIPPTTPGYPYSGGLAFTPDGKFLIASRFASAVSHNRAPGRLVRWTVPGWIPQPGFEPVTPFDRLAVDPSGEYLAGINTGLFELRYARSGGYHAKETPRVPRSGTRMHLAFSGTSEMVAFGWDSELKIMDVRTGKVRKTLYETRYPFRDAVFTTDGRRLATVSDDGFVTFYDVATWNVVEQYDWQCGPLRCLAFSPDGACGICGTSDGRLVVFDREE